MLSPDLIAIGVSCLETPTTEDLTFSADIKADPPTKRASGRPTDSLVGELSSRKRGVTPRKVATAGVVEASDVVRRRSFHRHAKTSTALHDYTMYVTGFPASDSLDFRLETTQMSCIEKKMSRERDA